MARPASRNAPATRLSALAWLAGICLLASALSGCGSPDEIDGRALFANNCAVCHGPSGEGAAQGPPLVDGRYLPDHLSDEGVAAAIRNGVPQRQFEFGPMPASPRLDDDEVDAIVEVVRELQRDAGLLEP